MGYFGVPPPQVASSSRLAPQDVLPPSSSSACKLRHLQDFPQDIPLPILCWTGSVTGLGFHLVCCCRGVRFCLLGGSFCVSKVMLSAFVALFVSGLHMVGVLKLMCQPVSCDCGNFHSSI